MVKGNAYEASRTLTRVNHCKVLAYIIMVNLSMCMVFQMSHEHVSTLRCPCCYKAACTERATMGINYGSTNHVTHAHLRFCVVIHVRLTIGDPPAQ